MNVLILTPDAVGSTLLQRLITIYMQFHEFDRPVINLHELSNGLIKYYSPDFNCEVLGKKPEAWGYYQTLKQIVEMLESVDHYKTSRLAQYHIRNRKDPISDQIPFYQYLNDNFYIIACRRQNVFEHALSWCINKITGKLNVYSAHEKVGSFLNIYKDGITVDPESLVRSLDNYKEYLSWLEQHFHVATYFDYERDLPRIEQYILNLPIFSGQNKKVTWSDTYGIDFRDWNLYHYLASDIGGLALDNPEQFRALVNSVADLDQGRTDNTWQNAHDLLLQYSNVADPSWPKIHSVDEYLQLPATIKQECEQMHGIVVNEQPVTATQNLLSLVSEQRRDFLIEHHPNYRKVADSLERMQELGIILNGPPIKKQTMAEKKFATRNFNELLSTYNRWADANSNIAQPIDLAALDFDSAVERQSWIAPAETLGYTTTAQISLAQSTHL